MNGSPFEILGFSSAMECEGGGSMELGQSGNK